VSVSVSTDRKQNYAEHVTSVDVREPSACVVYNRCYSAKCCHAVWCKRLCDSCTTSKPGSIRSRLRAAPYISERNRLSMSPHTPRSPYIWLRTVNDVPFLRFYRNTQTDRQTDSTVFIIGDVDEDETTTITKSKQHNFITTTTTTTTTTSDHTPTRKSWLCWCTVAEQLDAVVLDWQCQLVADVVRRRLRSTDTLVLCRARSHASVIGRLMLPVLNCGTVSQPSSASWTSNSDSLNDYRCIFIRQNVSNNKWQAKTIETPMTD